MAKWMNVLAVGTLVASQAASSLVAAVAKEPRDKVEAVLLQSAAGGETTFWVLLQEKGQPRTCPHHQERRHPRRIFSGTSMALPHVGGTVALMWSRSMTIRRDVAATRLILDNTAKDVSNLSCGGTADDNNVWGEGRLNAFGATSESPLP